MNRRSLLAALAGSSIVASGGCTSWGDEDWGSYPPGTGPDGVVDADTFEETIASTLEEYRYLVVDVSMGMEHLFGAERATTLYVDGHDERYYGESGNGKMAYYAEGEQRYEWHEEGSWRIEDGEREETPDIIERDPVPFARSVLNPRHPNLPFSLEWKVPSPDYEPFTNDMKLGSFSLTGINDEWASNHPLVEDVRDVGVRGIPPEEITLFQDGRVNGVYLRCDVKIPGGWQRFGYGLTRLEYGTERDATADEDVPENLPDGKPDWL